MVVGTEFEAQSKLECVN